jgi:hypothetical protein
MERLAGTVQARAGLGSPSARAVQMSDVSSPKVSAVAPAHKTSLISVGFIRFLLVFLLVLCLAVTVLGAFHLPMNGDEHIFLSNIHRAINGERLGLLQTAHVHLFRWLPSVAHDEIAQNMIGRMIHIGLWAGSLFLLYRLGRELLDPLGALVGTVLFAAFLLSVMHAVTFRIEGLLLPILLSVALLLLNPTVARVAGAGALSAVALALTVKTVLWAPAFIGVLAVGLWKRHGRLRPIFAGAVTGVATYAGILLAHRWAISTETNPGPGVSMDGLAGLGTYMFLDGFVPQATVLLASLVVNPATWALIIVGFGLAIAVLRDRESVRNSLILLFLASPILSLAFYTNAFAYTYVVLIPTACLLAGKAFSRFMGTAEGLRGVIALACLVSVAIPLIYFGWLWRLDHRQEQRQVVSTVHQLFEEPVPYIDAGGLMASFPRNMPVITRAVLTPFRRAGVPVVTNYIRDSKPPLLIVNSSNLDMWTGGVLDSVNPDTRLLPQDEAAIRATYAHYWSQIYLAGRQWSDLGADERREFEIMVPGAHTVLSSDPVIVDGQTYAPGATIALEAGSHELRTTAPEPDLRILWGKDLKLPSQDNLP